jgi:hypothetical protein
MVLMREQAAWPSIRRRADAGVVCISMLERDMAIHERLRPGYAAIAKAESQRLIAGGG